MVLEGVVLEIEVGFVVWMWMVEFCVDDSSDDGEYEY